MKKKKGESDLPCLDIGLLATTPLVLVCFLMASLRYHLVRKLMGVYKLMMLYTHQENKTTSKKETDQHLWRWFHSAQRRLGRSLWRPTQPYQKTNPFVVVGIIENYRQATLFEVVGASQTTDEPPLLGLLGHCKLHISPILACYMHDIASY